MSGDGRYPISRAGRAVAVAAALAAGCGEATPAPTDPGGGEGVAPVASVEVAPARGVLQIGDTLRFSATVRAADGRELRDRTIAWSSSGPAVADVNDQGLVRARGAGEAAIRAESEGKTAEVTVSVALPPPTVAWVQVVPASLVLPLGRSAEMRAVARAADDRVLSGRRVTWSSSADSVVHIDSLGRVFARRGGVAWITATVEGKIGRAEVVVPSWSEHTLTGAAGSALPAELYTRIYVDDGGEVRRERVVVAGGAFRLSTTGDGRYEQELSLRFYTDGVLTGWREFTDRGACQLNWIGELECASSMLSGQLSTLRGLGDGIAVTQRAGGEGPRVTLLFRQG